jgi:Mn2+/Fe2+ NRAMP family transporter
MALKFFGPGAIIASRIGAVFGYSVLWMAFITVISKGALVYASNRYITITGEHPMSRFAKIFPGPRGWFPILIGVLAIASFPSFSSGLSIALGTYLQQLGAGNAQAWAVGLIVVAAILSFLGGYNLLEKAQLVIVTFKVTLVIIAVFVSGPNWLAVLGGFVPNLPEYDAFVGQKYPDVAARPVFVEIVTFLGTTPSPEHLEAQGVSGTVGRTV